MDSGNNTSEVQKETAQPDEVVVTDSEATEAIPQATATEAEEFYIEEEGDQEQPNTSMTKEQSYAAFRKEKEKRQRKNELLKAEQDKANKLQSELDELKATVGKITKGKPPTLEQFEFDEGQYQNAMKEYYNAPQAKPKAKAQEETQTPSTDEADFYLYQREQELTEKMPQYSKSKDGFVDKLKNQFNEPDTDNALAFISSIAKDAKVDVAKAIYAMNEKPDLINELYASNNNPIVIGRILEKAASKVKLRSHKPIDTKPEPNITNSGPIDNSSEKVKKLRDKWKENPSTTNYNAYMKAKQQGE